MEDDPYKIEDDTIADEEVATFEYNFRNKEYLFSSFVSNKSGLYEQDNHGLYTETERYRRIYKDEADNQRNLKCRVPNCKYKKGFSGLGKKRSLRMHTKDKHPYLKAIGIRK